jgi:acetyl-CoA C-acetyltransferase
MPYVPSIGIELQVDGARITLAHNIGGPTAVSAVMILEGLGTDGR